MFERFTDRSRRALVVAQDEARHRSHNFIGTEHVLYGVLADSGALPVRALAALGVDIDGLRRDLETKMPGPVDGPVVASPPFTQRAKTALEHALGESVRLGHNNIDTEHLLLGLLSESGGIAGMTLTGRGVGLEETRRVIVDLLRASPPTPPASGGQPWKETATTPAAETALLGARKRAGSRPVGTHDLMAALLYSDRSAAVEALRAAGLDLDVMRRAVEGAVTMGTSDETPEEMLASQISVGIDADRIVVRMQDPTLLAALRQLPGADQPGIRFRPDPKVAHDLGGMWQQIHDALGRVVDALGDEPPRPPDASPSPGADPAG